MPSLSPIADAFDAVRRDRADEVLLIAPGEHRTDTAQDVHDAATALAQALTRTGLAAGHLVVCCVGNRAAMPALVLACLRERLPFLPLDRSTPALELAALADEWDAAAVVVPEDLDLPARSDDASQPARSRGVLGQGLAAYVRRPLPEPGRQAPAAMLKLTSGSTGAPRATCTEERHLIADVRHITAAMGIGPADRQLGVIPLSHSYGFANLLLPLLWQGTALLLRPQFVPTQVIPDIAAASLTTFAGVPFMFDHLARHQPGVWPSSMRLTLSAGARLPFETVDAFHRHTRLKIRSFYGSSETGGICFDASDALDERVPVGRPMGDTDVTLVADEDAPPGSGRVQVCGPNVSDRYLDAPGGSRASTGNRRDEEIGAATFVGPGTFLTGDYATIGRDGVYVLTGRAAAYVNVAGRKVHPGEVEAVLRTLPGVVEAVALAVDDPVRGQALGACLVGEGAWDARTVRAALSSRLAAWKLPRVVVTLPALPLTDRGKIDRAAIARRLGGED